MRIALVQDHLRLGGTERQTVELANSFSRLGHKVLALTFRPGGRLDGDFLPAVRRVSLQPRDWHLDWFAPRLVHTLRLFAPDLIQPMGRMANAHGWRLIHALPQVPLIATFRTGKSIPYFYAATLRRAAVVIANSEFAGRIVSTTYGVPPAHIRVIRNGVVTRPRPPEPDARRMVRAQIGTAPDAVVLLCVAMMRRGKGHRNLIEIAATLDRSLPCELWLAGGGTERTACEALARQRGIADRVRFLGERPDTNQLYASADLAVLASHTESLPNFLVEAQWSGLPVVAWDVAGVRETFVPGESGFLVPDLDRSGFVAAVHELASDASLRSSMSKAANTHARREFDPERQNARFLDVYAAMMKSRPST